MRHSPRERHAKTAMVWRLKGAEKRKQTFPKVNLRWRRLLRGPWTARRSNQSILKEIRSVLGVHWKDWCWSWNSNTLATWWQELTHLKRPWCWERLRAGGEGDDRRWGGWMASPTQWTRVWVDSGSRWWTGRPGVLRLMGLQRVGPDWATELNGPSLHIYVLLTLFPHFAFFLLVYSKKFLMNVKISPLSNLPWHSSLFWELDASKFWLANSNSAAGYSSGGSYVSTFAFLSEGP